MPTNANAYNSRITDEALEKKFRDAFRSQGGAELVDDLYASGVIVPVIDFTTAAEGSVLAQNLQTAWDFTTGNQEVQNASATIISNAGFWQVTVTVGIDPTAGADDYGALNVSDGLTTKPIWRVWTPGTSTENRSPIVKEFVVFLRSGDSLTIESSSGGNNIVNANWRQIADISGDLVNPSGFTSS
jgi:hypothetical protein